LASAVARLASGKGGQAPDPRTALLLLDVLCAVLPAVVARSEAGQAAGGRLAEVVGRLLDAVAAAEPTAAGAASAAAAPSPRWRRAVAAVRALLLTAEAAEQPAPTEQEQEDGSKNAAKSSGSGGGSGRVNAALLALLTEAAVGGSGGGGAAASAGLSRALVEAYARLLAASPSPPASSASPSLGELASTLASQAFAGERYLAARERPPRALCAAFGPVLAALPRDGGGGGGGGGFASAVLPAATRALRRTPEPAMACLAASLSAARGLALEGAPAAELAGLLVGHLRSKEGARPAALAALRALGQRAAAAAAGGGAGPGPPPPPPRARPDPPPPTPSWTPRPTHQRERQERPRHPSRPLRPQQAARRHHRLVDTAAHGPQRDAGGVVGLLPDHRLRAGVRGGGRGRGLGDVLGQAGGGALGGVVYLVGS